MSRMASKLLRSLPVVAATLLLAPFAAAQLPAQQTTPSTAPLPGISAQSADPLGRSLQSGPTLSPLTMPTITPGELELIKLEGDFSDAVSKGGGKAFASWFADDGITLSNGKPPVRGRDAIAAAATWDPRDYQLTWYAEGAQMGPNSLSGFTWGHYTSTAKDKNGQPVSLSGRYITVWKKVKGQWKVALDASANDVPAAGDCCALPKP